MKGGDRWKSVLMNGDNLGKGFEICIGYFVKLKSRLFYYIKLNYINHKI